MLATDKQDFNSMQEVCNSYKDT